MRALDEPAVLAREAGLSRVGTRPPFGQYVRDTVKRRHLIHVLASARLLGGVEGDRLGLLWLILGPLLNALVYFLIFGVLIGTNRGVDNFIAFVIIGVLAFSFIVQIETTCANSMRSNLGFIRSVHFPKAVIPLSTALLSVYQFLPSLLIMAAFALATGEPPALRWLLLLPAVVLATLFATALGLWLARVSSRSGDISKFLPFLNRTWLYLSGVIFYIPAFVDPPWDSVLEANPGAVYISLFREALMEGDWADGVTWLLGVGWALLILPALVYFWRAEGTYGRG